MSIMLNGAQYAIATVVSERIIIDGMSNANPGLALTDDTPDTGDVGIVLAAGWGELDEAPVRVGAVVDGVSFALSGYNTTDLTRFPAGEGAAQFVVASGFINLPKIHDIQKSGGEQNYATRQYYSDPTGKQVQAPTFKSARTRTYMLDYQPELPYFAALKELDRTQIITVLRETLRNGDVIYYAGRASFDTDPTTVLNEFISNAFAFAPTADSIRYPRVP